MGIRYVPIVPVEKKISAVDLLFPQISVYIGGGFGGYTETGTLSRVVWMGGREEVRILTAGSFVWLLVACGNWGIFAVLRRFM